MFKTYRSTEVRKELAEVLYYMIFIKSVMMMQDLIFFLISLPLQTSQLSIKWKTSRNWKWINNRSHFAAVPCVFIYSIILVHLLFNYVHLSSKTVSEIEEIDWSLALVTVLSCMANPVKESSFVHICFNEFLNKEPTHHTQWERQRLWQEHANSKYKRD